MSEAKNKLQEALNQAKARAKNAPKPQPPPAPAPKPSAEKPKAPAPDQAKKPVPKEKTPAPKKPGKKKPGAGSSLLKNIQGFAHNVLDEFKTATSEISPGALLSTATGGLKTLRKAVVFPSREGAPSSAGGSESAPAQNRPDPSPNRESPTPASGNAREAGPGNPSPPPKAPATPGQARPMTSPAKVQRAASKKKEVPEPENPGETAEAPEAPAGEPEPRAVAAPQAPGEQAPQYRSPTKVQRAASKKIEAPEPENPGETAEAPEAPAGEPEPRAVAAPQAPGEQPPQYRSPTKVQRATPRKHKDASDDTPAQTGRPDATEPIAERAGPDDLQENRPSSMNRPAPNEESPPARESQPKSEPRPGPDEPPESLEPPAEKKPAPRMQPVAISREEHAVRGFRALQTVLGNPIWKPVITDLEINTTSLFAPRAQFDAHFANPVFRDGLKAASRLAAAYSLPPDKIGFDPAIIQRVCDFTLDPEGKIKPHTETLTSVLGEEMVEKICAMTQDKPVKYLLYSVGTRLGTFVPTLEMLARIYLGLRKKEHISSGDRLKIQSDILMRYQKAPYTQEMAQKARNLALNYFAEYLVDLMVKNYSSSLEKAADSEKAGSLERRHAAIKASSFKTIDEWGQKIALAAPAINRIKGQFQEAADQVFQRLSEAPSEPDEEQGD